MMSEYTVGAPPEDIEEEDPDSPLQTPQILTTAADQANNLIGSPPLSDEDRERAFQYQARPFYQALDKQTEDLNKYYESQGMRFSTERREDITDIVEATGRQIGESVMVPMILNEKEQERANLQTAAQIGSAIASVELGNAQFNLQSVNDALERAVMQGRETGTFVDPITGTPYGTLAKTAQEASIDINERQTVVLEANAAVERAIARGESTGVFIDPVTGESIETLQGRMTALEERVQRAAAIGVWIEDDLVIDPEGLLADLDIDTDEYLGADEGDEVGDDEGGDDEGGDDEGRDADDALDEVTRIEAELAWIASLSAFGQETGVGQDAITAIATALGQEKFEQLFAGFRPGNGMTVAEITALFADQPDREGELQALANLWDYVVPRLMVRGDMSSLRLFLPSQTDLPGFSPTDSDATTQTPLVVAAADLGIHTDVLDGLNFLLGGDLVTRVIERLAGRDNDFLRALILDTTNRYTPERNAGYQALFDWIANNWEPGMDISIAQLSATTGIPAQTLTLMGQALGVESFQSLMTRLQDGWGIMPAEIAQYFAAQPNDATTPAMLAIADLLEADPSTGRVYMPGFDRGRARSGSSLQSSYLVGAPVQQEAPPAPPPRTPTPEETAAAKAAAAQRSAAQAAANTIAAAPTNFPTAGKATVSSGRRGLVASRSA